MEYYYKNYAPEYTSKQYNNTQKVRGYPDIAANGNNIVIYEQGPLLAKTGQVRRRQLSRVCSL